MTPALGHDSRRARVIVERRRRVSSPAVIPENPTLQQCSSRNFSPFVEGRSWRTCARGGMVAARLFSCDWLANGAERRRASARLYARQSV